MKNINLGQSIGILANIGVIAGILFLGYEVRQNTKVARQEAYNTFTQEINSVNFSITNDGELAELIARLQEGEEKSDFTMSEQIRVDLTLLALVRVWEGLYRSRQDGIADDSYFVGLSQGIGPFESSYFRAFWPAVKTTVDQDFAEFFEAQIWE